MPITFAVNITDSRPRVVLRAVGLWTCTLVLLSVAPCAAVGTQAESRDEGLVALVAQMDRLWNARETQGTIPSIASLGMIAYAIDPTRADASWRLARAYWWVARTQANRSIKKALATKANEWAERAMRAAPQRVEGPYYEALSIGEYAATIGFIEAVRQGIGGRVERAALRAYELDRDFDGGGPMVVLGRFYFVLPWPLRDLEKSRRYLEELRQRQPTKLIGRYYLAETYHALDEPKRARAELDHIMSSQPQPDDGEATHLAQEALAGWFDDS